MTRNHFLRCVAYLFIGFTAVCAIADVSLVNMGTTVINEALSPNGKWAAVIMVKNGGAASGYVTILSVVHARLPFKTQREILGSSVFSVDDNDGAVQLGDKGQIPIQMRWLSNETLLVEYPYTARVIRRNGTDGAVTINYGPKQLQWR